MSLIKKFKEVAEKNNIGGEATYVEYYPTGIDIVDYINGLVSTSGKKLIGLPAGRCVQLAGQPGSGKTTMAIQMAVNIARQYENGVVIHLDYERASSKERIMKITGMTEEEFENIYDFRNKEIYTETLYQACVAMAKLKKENYDEIKHDTGEVDSHGNPVYELPPTVVVLDSIATMMPKETIDDVDREAGTNMLAAQIAKVNSVIFKKLTSVLEEGNIILICINH